MMNDLRVAKLYLRKAQSARSKGIVFNLSFTSFRNLMKAKRCAYTGITMTDPAGDKILGTDRTVDRVDNTKGYIKGNVVACCHSANQLKSILENPNNVVGFDNIMKMVKKVHSSSS